MIRAFVLYFVLISFSSYGQAQNWEMTAYKTNLPDEIGYCQYYAPENEMVINMLITYPKKGKKRSKKESEMVEGDSFQSAFNFLKTHLNDSSYLLPLSSFDCDTAEIRYLEENGFIEDSSLAINFNLFERQANKIVKPCEDCLPVIYFDRHHVDGERLRIKIKEDSIEIITLNIGVSERSRIHSFRNWILLYLAYHEYDLFEKMSIEYYFSRKKLSSEIARYVKVLRR